MKRWISMILGLALICVSLSHSMPAYAADTGEGRVGNAGITYYYIRNTDYVNYLTVPTNSASGSKPYANYFLGVSETRQKWKIQKISSGKFYIMPADADATALSVGNADWDIFLFNKSTGLQASTWEIKLQDDGTWKIYSLSYVHGYASGSKALGLKENGRGRKELTVRDPSESGTNWFFEEVLADRNDTAAPISYDHTVKTSNYSAYGHAAFDVAPKGSVKKLPIYAPYDGLVSYWVNTAISESGKNVTARIGNFVTVDRGTTGGTLFAHMDQFYPYTSLASTLPNYPATQSGATHYSRYNPSVKNTYYASRGEKIGYVGQSGSATGYHLHIEYFVKNGTASYENVWLNPSDKHYTWLYAGAPNAWTIGDTYKNSVTNSHQYLKHWGYH